MGQSRVPAVGLGCSNRPWGECCTLVLWVPLVSPLLKWLWGKVEGRGLLFKDTSWQWVDK